MSRDEMSPLQIELRDKMRDWGCPLCKLTAKAEATFIESLNYERVLDLKTRDALKASRGLCSRHARQWEGVQGSALGIGIVYRITLLDLLRDTEEARSPASFLRLSRGRSADDLTEQLAASGPCPACVVGDGTAANFVDLLLRDVADPAAYQLLVGCGGLCLPHLRLALSRPGPARRAENLIRAQREAWKALMAELDEFIRKNDYRFVHESMTSGEGSSWYRALDAAVGARSRRPS